MPFQRLEGLRALAASGATNLQPDVLAELDTLFQEAWVERYPELTDLLAKITILQGRYLWRFYFVIFYLRTPPTFLGPLVAERDF